MFPSVSKPVLRVVLGYALVAAIWVLASDRIVDLLFPDHASHLVVQTYKGWFFVLITATLLYVLLRRMYERVQASTDARIALADQEAKSAAMLKALADTSAEVVVAKDFEGRYLMFNREAAAVTGRLQANVIGRDDQYLFPPEQAAELRSRDLLALEQGQLQVFETSLDTVRGRRTFLATTGVLRTGDTVLGTYTVARDITEMATSRRLLESAERRYRMMFERNPVPMLVVDLRSLRFLAVNQAAIDLYGFDQNTFLQMSLADIRPPEYLGQMIQTLDIFGETDRPKTIGPLVHWKRNQQRVDVMVSACDLEVDGIPSRLIMVNDVTDQLQAERERDETHARLRDILSRVTDGFMAVSPDQCLTYINPQAAQLIAPNTNAHSLIGQRLWDLLPGAVGSRCSDALLTSMVERRSIVFEHWFEPWQRWVECRFHPSTQGVSVYFTDITERRQTAETLERSQKDLSALAKRLMEQEQIVNRRIAQTLHDQLAQDLSSARLYVDAVQSARLVEGSPEQGLLTRVSGILSNAIEEVRSVLHDLRPPLLEEYGLATALDNEMRNSPAHVMEVGIALEVPSHLVHQRWSPALEQSAFMIAREAIANALKHAQAKVVSVSLDGNARRLLLQITDDGCGIAATDSLGVAGHLGIVGMRERALAVGGELRISTLKGGGTQVRLLVEDIVS